MKLDYYETIFGIYNHSGADSNALSSQLKLVALHPAEDASANSRLYERMKQYIECEVFQTTGLSWKEFIEQPNEIVVMQLELSLQKQKLKASITEDILRKQ